MMTLHVLTWEGEPFALSYGHDKQDAGRRGVEGIPVLSSGIRALEWVEGLAQFGPKTMNALPLAWGANADPYEAGVKLFRLMGHAIAREALATH